MRDATCRSVDRFLEDRFSGDGPAEPGAELLRHAGSCERCRREFEAEGALDALAGALKREAQAAPPASRIVARLPARPPAVPASAPRGWRLAAACLLVLSGAAISLYLDSRAENERLLERLAQTGERAPGPVLEERLRDLEEELAEYRSKIEHLRTQGIDVARLAETKVPAPLDGKVVAVHTGVGLIMVNLGERHGVEKGMNFTVYRADQYVGQILVEEVFPDMASARIDSRFQKLEIQEGDDVTTRIR